MATLRDYFNGDFTTGSIGRELALTSPVGAFPPVTVKARCHNDFAAFTRYVSYFVPSEVTTDPAVCEAVLQQVVMAAHRIIELTDTTISMTQRHPVMSPEGTDSRELPFSGRVFLYVDTVLPQSIKSALLRQAQRSHLALEFRDHAYAAFRDGESPQAFICHDSRDKDSLVRPLALKLGHMLCRVWYDEFSLKPGDSLREGIDTGLHAAPKCIVVLSPAFLSNPGWTKGEFNAIVNRHFTTGHSVLIPVWHTVTAADVRAYSELVADIVALKTDSGIDDLVRKLYRAVSP